MTSRSEPEIVAINRCKKPGNEIKASWREDSKKSPPLTWNPCCSCFKMFPVYTDRQKKRYVRCGKCATRLAGVRFPDFKMVVK